MTGVSEESQRACNLKYDRYIALLHSLQQVKGVESRIALIRVEAKVTVDTRPLAKEYVVDGKIYQQLSRNITVTAFEGEDFLTYLDAFNISSVKVIESSTVKIFALSLLPSAVAA